MTTATAIEHAVVSATIDVRRLMMFSGAMIGECADLPQQEQLPHRAVALSSRMSAEGASAG